MYVSMWRLCTFKTMCRLKTCVHIQAFSQPNIVSFLLDKPVHTPQGFHSQRQAKNVAIFCLKSFITQEREPENEDPSDDDDSSSEDDAEDNDDDASVCDSDDSGSHNEPTEPEPLADEPERPPVPKVPLSLVAYDEPAASHSPPPVKESLKKFWSKYVVPKNPKVAPPSQDDGTEASHETAPESPTMENGSEVDDRESAGGSSNDHESDGGLMSEDDENHENDLQNDVDSDSIDSVLASINPEWKADVPLEHHTNGRFYTLFPPGVDHMPPLPRTPSIGGPFWEEPEEEPVVSDSEGSTSEDEPKERYNPGGKADDMPPCGKFGVEDLCSGPDCKACQLALDSDRDVSGVVQSTYALAEFFGNTDPGDKKRKAASSESVLTLKTPPSKKPDFFGRAVVDTPEKKPAEKTQEAGL